MSGTRKTPLGIYVHLPFCPYICPYCDFAKWPMRRSDALRYLDALHVEIERTPAALGRTLFLGGGTPNAYAPQQTAQVIRKACARFSVPEGAEISIEINPDLALCEGFDTYRRAGANRLSIGVQSFDERELRVLGRRHSADDVREVVRRAREVGFKNISLDLIFAAPGQTPETWRHSLETAIAMKVEHISAYGLTVEAGTPFAELREREPERFLSSDAEAELYSIAIELLGDAGYEQYEISNFAKPGFRCEHNRGYWNNDEYLGLGVGAASYLDGTRRTNTRDLHAYCEALESEAEIPGEAETLDPHARAGEAAMLALRRVEGVELAAYARRYGVDFLGRYQAVIAEMEEAGMLSVGETHVALTERGRFVANDVCAAFIA